jgi:hypothetical protein
MELTKNQSVLKSLVEHMLSRHHKGLTQEPLDVECGIKILDMLLPKSTLYLIATSPRIAQDFAQAMGRPFVHVAHVDVVRGIKPDIFVQLHTGMRTPSQDQVHFEIMKEVYQRFPVIKIWHIGNWRV